MKSRLNTAEEQISDLVDSIEITQLEQQTKSQIGGGEKKWKHYETASVQFSPSGVSDSLQTHEPQHARPPCPSPAPGVHPNPCPLSQWCHPTISSSVAPFSCPQSLPASGSFQMNQLFTSGGQSIGVSASTSVLPMNTQWRRKWQPTPVILPGEFHEQRSLAGYSPWGCRVRHDWATITHTYF